MNKLEVTATCSCGSEIMQVQYWDDEKSFCFTQFKYLPIRFSLLRRIKFLFTGRISYNEIILEPKDAMNIADFIYKNS
jgi:hypothetical protein